MFAAGTVEYLYKKRRLIHLRWICKHGECKAVSLASRCKQSWAQQGGGRGRGGGGLGRACAGGRGPARRLRRAGGRAGVSPRASSPWLGGWRLWRPCCCSPPPRPRVNPPPRPNTSPRSRRSPLNSWRECWKTRISSRCTGVSATRPPPADRRASPFNFASFRKLAAGQGGGGRRRVETSATAPVQMGYRRVNDLRTGRGEDRLDRPELSAVCMIFSKRAARFDSRVMQPSRGDNKTWPGRRPMRPSARPKMVPSLVFHRSTDAGSAKVARRLRS